MSNKENLDSLLSDLENKMSNWKKCGEQKVGFEKIKESLNGLAELKVFVEAQIKKDINKVKELKEWVEKSKHGGNIG